MSLNLFQTQQNNKLLVRTEEAIFTFLNASEVKALRGPFKIGTFLRLWVLHFN